MLALPASATVALFTVLTSNAPAAESADAPPAKDEAKDDAADDAGSEDAPSGDADTDADAETSTAQSDAGTAPEDSTSADAGASATLGASAGDAPDDPPDVSSDSAGPDPDAPASDAAEDADAEAKAEPEEDKNLPTFAFGLQVFLRGEGRFNPDFAADTDPPSQWAILERVRLQGKSMWGPLTAFVQFQDARAWGFEGSTTSNEANTDLHQGYLEVGGKTKNDKMSGFIRAGRQEIAIGKQRLIGPLAWMPNARSFDALALHGEHGIFRLDVMGALLQSPGQVSEPDPDPTEPPLTANSQGAQLAGVVFGVTAHKAIGAEVVGLFLREDGKNGAIGFDRTLGNAGARVWGSPIQGLTYDAEGNVQFGENNTREHFAWAWAATVGYLHPFKKVQPGGHVGYAMASGEGCEGAPGDPGGCGADKSTEFFNFYPTNHLYYGAIDLFGWRNMRDLEVGLDMAVPSALKKLTLTYHFFQLNDPAGRWSNAGGANVGAGWDPDNTDRNVGHEIDLFAVIKPWKPFMIQPGYSIFLPTGAGRSLGGDDAQHYAWLWMVLNLP